MRFLPTIAEKFREDLGKIRCRSRWSASQSLRQRPDYSGPTNVKGRLTNVDHLDLSRQRTASFHVFVV